MLFFVLLAAALLAAAVTALAVPLLRRTGATAAPAAVTALSITAVLGAGSVLLYLLWSNWHWQGTPAADSPQNMVSRLARRLERKPDDLAGWLMLGRSYLVLQEYPLAVRAFERADQLGGGRNAEALLGEAEGLAAQDPAQLDGRAGELIDRALQLSPDSGRAVFFGATLAERRGDLALARQRFARLLQMNPPDSIRPILEQQVEGLDSRLAAKAGGAAAGPAGVAAPVAAPAGPDHSTDSATQVRITVSLAPGVAASLGNAPLFVFARNPGQPGPPLAVKRLPSQFPQSVILSAADAMVPGRALVAGQRVQIVARIARGGGPVAARGDPFGELTATVGDATALPLVIDRITP
ncbi:MAG: hypothetical protein JSR67_14295 [Proteobacteria bacterium]|nr:hypothetical protein [Pseudomonadota bacterium]